MKERGILFSAPMIRALLAGTKTMTRRLHEIKADKLWVKETFRVWDYDVNGVMIDYRAGGDDRYVVLKDKPRWLYNRKMDGGKPWRPSIFMPKWASRITLEVTGKRAEPLQDISARDIISEGAVARPHEDKYLGKMPVSAFDGKAYPDLKSLWGHGWESIHGPGSWEKNPLVWVISFKRL